MTALELIAHLLARGVLLTAKGDRLAYDAPTGTMTPEAVDVLKANKAALLALLASKPDWREDELGRLIFSDGTIYGLTDTGGWILVQHATRRMIEPGLLALQENACCSPDYRRLQKLLDARATTTNPRSHSCRV